MKRSDNKISTADTGFKLILYGTDLGWPCLLHIIKILFLSSHLTSQILFEPKILSPQFKFPTSSTSVFQSSSFKYREIYSMPHQIYLLPFTKNRYIQIQHPNHNQICLWLNYDENLIQFWVIQAWNYDSSIPTFSGFCLSFIYGSTKLNKLKATKLNLIINFNLILCCCQFSIQTSRFG